MRARFLIVVLLLLAAFVGCRDTALHHYNLGIEAMERGDTAKAIGEFEQSIAARPDDPDSHINLGVALLVAALAATALGTLAAGYALFRKVPVA